MPLCAALSDPQSVVWYEVSLNLGTNRSPQPSVAASVCSSWLQAWQRRDTRP